MKASIGTLIKNYVSAMALILLIYAYYQANPYYQGWFSSTHNWPWFSISDAELFRYGLYGFAVLLIPFYATIPDSRIPKSRLVWRALFNLRQRLPLPEERIAILATLVKAFFLPLMAAWLFANGANFFRDAQNFWDTRSFFSHGYWTIFNLILFIDVTFFALAYAVEHPALRNEIKSVEPTLLGWSVAIICYPPFNGVTNQMLGWYSADYPNFDTSWIQWLAGIAILTLMTIYVWATVALNLKASNLTNRGIVTWGPYAYIRHPAYVCKNLAWWIGSLPILAIEYQRGGLPRLLYAVFAVGTWTFIYYLRAVTEERHLMKDPDYQAYCRSVPGYLPRRRRRKDS